VWWWVLVRHRRSPDDVAFAAGDLPDDLWPALEAALAG
jgi:hypothetical protein